MSASKLLLITSMCIILAGCVPTSANSIWALVIAVVAAIGAAVGLNHERTEDRVARKANELHEFTEQHVSRYHSRDEHG